MPDAAGVRSPSTSASPIVIDGVHFQGYQQGGVARVWRSLLAEWLRTGFSDRIVFLDRGGSGPKLAGMKTRSIPPWRADLSARDSIRLQQICDQEEAALFVSTYYTTPIATPTLLLVHDMIPERLGVDLSDPVWEEKQLAIEYASAYACVSESTRRDLFELRPSARTKPSTVVLLGVDGFSVPRDLAVEAFRRRFRIDRPYFLVVGDRRGIQGYKNLGQVFRALRDWPAARAHELVCVGGNTDVEPELRRIAPRLRVRRVSLSDEDLCSAYAGAVALLFPSRYEGFGLPVAEAMASGCPVITTPGSSMSEVAGDAALYVDPDDTRALVTALDVVREPSRRADLITAGLARAASLRWSRTASELAGAISAAADEDTPDRRHARESVWRPFRRAQSDAQRPARRRTGAHADPARPNPIASRLRFLARRYSPPAAIAGLGAARSAFLRALRRADRSVPGRRTTFDGQPRSPAGGPDRVATALLGLCLLEPRSAARRAVARGARRLRRRLPARVDPLVECVVGRQPILLPLSHELPFILAQFPRYGENLVDLVDVVVRGKGSCGLVDIGANVGDTIAMVRSRVELPVLGIEGDELYAQLLARNVSAITDVEIEVSYVASGVTVGPTRVVRAAGTATLVPSDEVSPVVTRSLGEILSSHPRFALPGIVKLDTDGADAAIIVANAEWLARVRPVVFFEYYYALAAEAGDREPWRAFAVLARAGYGKAIVYANTGELLLEASVSDERLWRDLALPRSSPPYVDVAVFPTDDTELFEQAVARERARCDNGRGGQAPSEWTWAS